MIWFVTADGQKPDTTQVHASALHDNPSCTDEDGRHALPVLQPGLTSNGHSRPDGKDMQVLSAGTGLHHSSEAGRVATRDAVH